uniref:Uncharacterized protein n=1 Tax=Setaria viridis TaxID=4556 RepID=A0A4U6T1A1_SETVI|nr:hypothetical protein SEVIR_9G235725v2 [Setaria viridis]
MPEECLWRPDLQRNFYGRLFVHLARLHRNDIIFDGHVLSLGRCMERHIFKEEFALTLHRAKPSLKLELGSWFCNFR